MLNNVAWCDAVCRARGTAGRTTQYLWVNEHPTPPYYPNIITLQPSSAALRGELGDAIDRVRAMVGDSVSIKDSFADVDLNAHGLRVLFEAQWVAWPSSLPAADARIAGVEWSLVRTEPGLDEWKRAWDAEILSVDPVFAPDLLRSTDIAFIAAHRDGELVGGAIANASAGIVGLSNVFAPAHRNDDFRAGCAAVAMTWAPGLPLVGYETGAELDSCITAGLTTLGPLRVWVSAD